MKTIQKLVLLTLSAAFISCSSNDDAQLVNEEESITKAILTFKSATNQDDVVLTFEDLDGDGPNAPIYQTQGTFKKNQTYQATIQFFNLAENITNEILEEATAHQLFYINHQGFKATSTYLDQDDFGNPIGLQIQTTIAADAQNGKINVILKHLLNKDAADITIDNPANAGGSTDLNINFPVVVE